MAKTKKHPSWGRLRELFRCDGSFLYWKAQPNNDIDISRPAGCLDKDYGYRIISVDHSNFKAHRLIWIYHFGDIPEGKEIDHIDHDRSNNRLDNLRLVTNQGNHKNQSKPKNNTSGVTGVYWHKQKKKWIARIKVNGKLIHLGVWKNFYDAIIMRKLAETYYGFHPNHGVEAV